MYALEVVYLSITIAIEMEPWLGIGKSCDYALEMCCLCWQCSEFVVGNYKKPTPNYESKIVKYEHQKQNNVSTAFDWAIDVIGLGLYYMSGALQVPDPIEICPGTRLLLADVARSLAFYGLFIYGLPNKH